MILLIILLVLFIIGESENDIVMTNPKLSFFPKWDWYIRYNYTGNSWWIKNVISPIGDGFHSWKAVTILVTAYFFCGDIDISRWWAIAIFILAGTYHSLRNGSLLRKKKEEADV